MPNPKLSGLGGFKPHDKIKQTPSASASNGSPRFQDKSLASPAAQQRDKSAIFLGTDGALQVTIDIDNESSTGGGVGGGRRLSQSFDNSKHVSEFRNIDRKAGARAGRNRPRRPPDTSKTRRPQPKLVSTSSSTRAELAHDRINDSPDELTSEPKEVQIARKRRSVPVDLTGDESPKQKRQQNKQTTTHSMEFTVDIKNTKSKAKRDRIDEIDELNDDESRPPTKKTRTAQGPSPATSTPKVSSRADLPATTFLTTKSPANTRPSVQVVFTVSKAVRGPHYLCEEPQVLKLDTTDPDPALHAYRQDGQAPSPHYDWLVVKPSKLTKVLGTGSGVCLVMEYQGAATEGGKSFLPKLYLECPDVAQAHALVSWIKSNQGREGRIKFELVNSENDMRKRFDNQFSEMKAAKQKQSLPDDVQLQQINQNRRLAAARPEGSTGTDVPTPQPPRKKLIDALISKNKPDPAEVVVAKNHPSINVRGDRTLRSRQPPTGSATNSMSRFEPLSRTPSPPPPKPKKLWTEENRGWDKDWRVDLSQFRTTIHKGDIGRLEEGEYLNDSIISFYLQYLHEAVKVKDPTVARRFYFQSSFFWDQLKANKKGISYDKVKSWTNRVDLFSYDFIVVPVNENAHWFVAVICNPGKLLQAAGEGGGGTPPLLVNEADARHNSSPAGTQNLRCSHLSPGTEMSTGMDKLSLDQRAAEEQADEAKTITIDDDEEVISTATGLKPGSGKDDSDEACLVKSDLVTLHKGGKSEDKSQADTREGFVETQELAKFKEAAAITEKDPCIITFDSLGSRHSPVCTALKKYLEHEAKHKKGLELTLPSMGRTAQNIPLQNNYWDCGVFLMSYIQALMQDPDGFIRKVLPKKSSSAEEGRACEVDATAMRNLIRVTILEQQALYQKKVEDEAEMKRQRKIRRQRPSSASLSSSQPGPRLSPSSPQVQAVVHASHPSTAHPIASQDEELLPSVEDRPDSITIDESADR